MKRIIFLIVMGAGLLNPAMPPADPPPVAEHITALLVMDNSGSMKTNDPEDLRFTGIRLFASLMSRGDALGVILFSAQANSLTDGIITLDAPNAGVPHLRGLQFPPAEGYTDLKSALELARDLLERSNQPAGKTVLILLTDGKPELPGHHPQYEQQTLAAARDLNVPIMAIALTSAAQTPFLDRLAYSTGGSVTPAGDASDLLDAYLKVLGQIKDRTVISFEAAGSEGILEIGQSLAPYVNSVTFVGAKSGGNPIVLLGPDNRPMSSDLSPDPRFSLFTLQDPAGGRYTFRSLSGGQVRAWAILQTRLRVEILSPAAIHPQGKAMRLEVNLLEETSAGHFTKIIGEAAFSAHIVNPDGTHSSLDRFFDDGTNGDLTAGDGIFTRLYPDTQLPGGYQVAIQGWKGTIPVQTDKLVQVLPFPEIQVLSPLGPSEVRGAPLEVRVHLTEAETLEQGRLFAVITDPGGGLQEMELLGGEIFSGTFLPLEDGTYHARIELRDGLAYGTDYQTQIGHVFAVSIIPYARVLAGQIHPPLACIPLSNEVRLLLDVTASQAGAIRFSSPGLDITPDMVNVRKGQQEVRLNFLLPSAGSGGVSFRAEIFMDGLDGLEVQPDALEIVIPSATLWTRCAQPLRWGGALLIVALVAGLSIRRAKTGMRPLPVRGTLRHWTVADPSGSAEEVDLTEYGKPALLIGNSTLCDVVIVNAGLDPEHARLLAGQSPQGSDLALEPVGAVIKGYSRLTTRFILKHGDIVSMGSRQFQYLSDSGE